jgi:hypothetical protein|tara:strand:- start:308 stop:934 length:627 start_codon:yes stop_codon:yes gene_type:complete
MRWFLLFVFLAVSANAQNDQQGDLNTNTQDSTVNSNNSTTNNSKTFNGAGSSSQMPVYSAISPSLMSSGNDTCLKSKSGGAQFVMIGISAGQYMQDEKCNRRKDAKTLKELGMSIAAVSLMCQEKEIWTAMFTSGTPCPILVNGKLVVGRAAMMAMRQLPTVFIPDYVKRKPYYDAMLNIGETDEIEEVDSGASISERFRTSTNSGGD